MRAALRKKGTSYLRTGERTKTNRQETGNGTKKENCIMPNMRDCKCLEIGFHMLLKDTYKPGGRGVTDEMMYQFGQALGRLYECIKETGADPATTRMTVAIQMDKNWEYRDGEWSETTEAPSIKSGVIWTPGKGKA